MTRSFVLSSSLVVLMMAAGGTADADWIEDGIPVCIAPAAQLEQAAVSDGSGGEFIVWTDYRDQPTTGTNIYAQHVDADGVALWTANGIPICALSGNQIRPAIASDGTGGAIIVWEDGRNPADSDIYGQHVDGAGNPQWAANGIPICSATNNQLAPQIHSSGFIVLLAWEDWRNGNPDIYVQRLLPDGGGAWPANGVAVCTAAGNQRSPRIIGDSSGGAIVTWEDWRDGDPDVYAGAVNFLGTPVWTYNGVAVGVDPGTQQTEPRIIGDDADGAIVVWEDYRNGDYDVYGQRLNYSGNALWTANGAPISMAANNQLAPEIAPDGAGGAFVAWSDYRIGTHFDVYAQHVTALGVPYWKQNGILIAAPRHTDAQDPMIASDGEGGALIAWLDSDQGLEVDIYAQRVDGAGQFWWGPIGVAVSAAPGSQYKPSLVSSGGAALTAWNDERGGLDDVYAQRLEPNHGWWGRPEPRITSAADNPGDQGGQVALTWLASERDAYPLQTVPYYSIWRAVGAVPVVAGARPADAQPRIVTLDQVGRGFEGDAYRIERTAAGSYYWEFVGTQDAIASPGYGDLVPTRQDSSSAGTALHYFQVVAHTYSTEIFFASAPDSAYSVDNLAPVAPISLSAMRAGGQKVDLIWSPGDPVDTDLAGYRIYRSPTPDFPTGPASFLMAVSGVTATDAAASPDVQWYYKVVAVDVHGNLSGDSNEAWVGTVTAVEDDIPAVASFTVRPNTPNPFRTSSVIRFGLPTAGAVTFEIYDVAGHRVVARQLQPMAAGWHRYAFDSRDDAGVPLPSGMYFYRVRQVGAHTAGITRKMVIER